MRKTEEKCGADLSAHAGTSHERSLVAARGHSEPAEQVGSREMEIVRIKAALQRAKELADDANRSIR